MKPDDSPECEICANAQSRVCEECVSHSRFVSFDEDLKIDEWDLWLEQEKQNHEEVGNPGMERR